MGQAADGSTLPRLRGMGVTAAVRWQRTGPMAGARYDRITFDDTGPETPLSSVRPRAADLRARPAAESGFRRALELDPSYGLGRQAFGHMLSQTGRHAEGIAELQRARELDPLDPVPAALSSQVAFQARDFRAATRHAERAIQLNPGFWFGYQMLGQAQERLGLAEASMIASSRAMELSGRNSKPVALYGYTLAREGRSAEARALLASLEVRSREQYVPPYTMALIHAGLGDQVAVLDWLERAYAVRDVHLIYLPAEPKWDPYRADPRFAAILARCRFTTR